MKIDRHSHVLLGVVVLSCLLAACSMMFEFLLREWLPHWNLAADILAAGLVPIAIVPPAAYAILSFMHRLALDNRKLRETVLFDQLTRVYSRNAFLEVAERHFEGAKGRSAGAMLIVDADRFKSINDRLGHDTGDIALQLISSVLLEEASNHGYVGRLGGEEFALFLPRASMRTLCEVANRICLRVSAEGRVIKGMRVDLTVSIGGALHLQGMTLAETLKQADIRLYKAKSAGRNRYRVDRTFLHAVSLSPQAA